MFQSISGDFPRIFGISKIFFVALMNCLAISRLFLSRKYFLKIKRNPFLFPYSFTYFWPVATFSPTDEVCCRPLYSVSQFSFSRPQPGPLRPNHSDPQAQLRARPRKPIRAQVPNSPVSMADTACAGRRLSLGIRAVHAKPTSRHVPYIAVPAELPRALAAAFCLALHRPKLAPPPQNPAVVFSPPATSRFGAWRHRLEKLRPPEAERRQA
jgi:hypothetical protein